MQELYKQIHIYLNMDEEISFEEFDRYYKKVLNYLNEHGNDLDEDHVWRALFIAENLLSNADARAKTEKRSTAKKFSKIDQRMSLWAQNLSARLMEKGYTEEQLQERFEEMFDAEDA